jgi:hypothetical protein
MGRDAEEAEAEAGGWRKLYTEELPSLCLSICITHRSASRIA